MRAKDCQKAFKHTPIPDYAVGYVAWMEWAEKKAKTHEQIKCPVCQTYSIWKRKAEK